MANEELSMGLNETSLNHAQDLVRQLEAGNYEEAEHVIRKLFSIHENSLFQDIGKLTRELHEAINGFNDDSRLNTLVREDMPGAKERLDYVIKTTEQSAHRTLNAVEYCMPAAHDLGERAELLQKRWHVYMHNTEGDEEFDTISAELDEYLLQVMTDTKMIYSGLSDVLVAQDYQDITGQILQRIIKLVQEVEQSLVGMLCITSVGKTGDSQKNLEHDNTGYGPAVPGVTRGDVMQNQDDVDDLLSTLGF